MADKQDHVHRFRLSPFHATNGTFMSGRAQLHPDFRSAGFALLYRRPGMIQQNQSSAYRLMSLEVIEAEFGVLVEIPSLPSGALDMEAINFHLATNSLWTLVDGGPVPTFTSGYHLVNRMGYYRSEKSVPVGMIIDEQLDESIGLCSDCDALWDIDSSDACPNCGGRSFAGPAD